MSDICEECGKFIEDEFDKWADTKDNCNKYYHKKCWDKANGFEEDEEEEEEKPEEPITVKERLKDLQKLF